MVTCIYGGLSALLLSAQALVALAEGVPGVTHVIDEMIPAYE